VKHIFEHIFFSVSYYNRFEPRARSALVYKLTLVQFTQLHKIIPGSGGHLYANTSNSL